MVSVPTRDQVSPGAQVSFDLLKSRMGKVPNLYAAMGYSEFALKAFLDFEETLYKGVFTPKEREAVALIVSEINGCAYCLAGHTIAAIKRGFTKEETLAIRKGETNDPRLKAIVRLAASMSRNKGHAEESTLDAFYAAGFDEGALMELVGLVTVRVFTNYVFAVTGVPIDFPRAQVLKTSDYDQETAELRLKAAQQALDRGEILHSLYGLNNIALSLRDSSVVVFVFNEDKIVSIRPYTQDGESVIGQQFLTALKERNWSLMRSVLADDASWTLPGTSLLSGEAAGAEAVINRAKQLRNFGVTLELNHLLVGESGFALSLHNTATRGSLLLDEQVAIVCDVRDGKISKITTHLNDVEGINQFFIEGII